MATPGVVETHSALVFFTGERAYKLKKPVDLGFLDFSSVESRALALRRELELNRRLSPDVYLDVLAVTGSDGTIRDHLLEMRAMPPDRRLATLAAAGADLTDHLRSLAHLVVGFHAAADRHRGTEEAAGAEATRARWHTNAEEMRALLGGDDLARSDALLDPADTYIDGRTVLFAERTAAGRSCDGHGDLLADDIFCLDDGPRVLDCIEFDDRLRWGDVLADVAFLAMDLERLGRADLARRWSEEYRQLSGDHWPPSLEHHHIAYRAQVRAKVAAIRAAQGDPEAGDTVRRLLDLSADHLERGRVRLVTVGGLPGTGKSTVAAALGPVLDAFVLRTDEIRKELAGLDPRSSAPDGYEQGLYDPAHTAATYAEVFHRAAAALARGYSVVVDGSFADTGHRSDAAALAAVSSAELRALHCVVDAETASERIRQRTDDPSDADPAVATRMSEVFAPWPDAIELDTSGPPASVVERAVAAIG